MQREREKEHRGLVCPCSLAESSAAVSLVIQLPTFTLHKKEQKATQTHLKHIIVFTSASIFVAFSRCTESLPAPHTFSRCFYHRISK